MSTEFLRYCCLVVSAAWGHSRSWTQGIIFFILVIVGTATLLAPNFGMIIETNGLMDILKTPTFYAILFGSIVLVRLICAPYWIWSEERAARIKAQTEVAELSARHILSKNTIHNALSIEFLRDDLHEIVQTFPVGTIRRRLKISVLNRGDGWLSNCRLSVEQTAPSIYDTAIELMSGFTLQIDERRYSEFLYFDERFAGGNAAPKVLLARQSGGFFYVEIGFSTTQPTIFTLKATSNEASESMASFRAFVENGRLQVERL